MEQKKGLFKLGIFEIAIAGIFGAIALVLSFTPAGMIPLPNGTGAVTTMLVPVIISAVLAGPFVGSLVGLILAGASWVLYSGMFIAFANNNMAIGLAAAVLPRILVGPLAWLCYRLIVKLPIKFSSLAGSVGSAIIGTSVNTFGLFGILILFGSTDTVFKVFIGALVLNYPLEIIFSVFANIAIIEAIRTRSPERISASR